MRGELGRWPGPDNLLLRLVDQQWLSTTRHGVLVLIPVVVVGHGRAVGQLREACDDGAVVVALVGQRVDGAVLGQHKLAEQEGDRARQRADDGGDEDNGVVHGVGVRACAVRVACGAGMHWPSTSTSPPGQPGVAVGLGVNVGIGVKLGRGVGVALGMVMVGTGVALAVSVLGTVVALAVALATVAVEPGVGVRVEAVGVLVTPVVAVAIIVLVLVAVAL